MRTLGSACAVFNENGERDAVDFFLRKYRFLVVCGALLGGNANNGANAGFGNLNTNNRSSNSNANNGFRLYRSFFDKIKYFNSYQDHASWQKNAKLK